MWNEAQFSLLIGSEPKTKAEYDKLAGGSDPVSGVGDAAFKSLAGLAAWRGGTYVLAGLVDKNLSDDQILAAEKKIANKMFEKIG